MNYGKFIKADFILASQLKFLGKAVSTDTRWESMNYIHVEPSEKDKDLLLGVAMDGRRLHLVDPIDNVAAKAFGLTAGYWQLLGGGKKEVWITRLEDSETERFVYPNWRKVIPTSAPEYETTFSGFAFTGTSKNFPALAKFLHEFPEATALNLEYLRDIGTGIEWRVQWIGKNSVVKFIEGDRLVLIMPMTIE